MNSVRPGKMLTLWGAFRQSLDKEFTSLDSWTKIRQILFGFSIQCLSNHTMVRSTENLSPSPSLSLSCPFVDATDLQQLLSPHNLWSGNENLAPPTATEHEDQSPDKVRE